MGHRSDLPSSWGYSSKGTEFSFFDCRRDLPPTRRFNSGWGPGALDKIIFAARGSTVLNSLEGKGSPRVLFETWKSRGRVGDFRSKWVAAHMPVCCDWSSRFRLLPTRVRLRLIHGDSGEFVSHFSECFFALAADHIGKIDCPCLGKLIERRGEAASIHHLQTNTTS
jgi:hypothetical protein